MGSFAAISWTFIVINNKRSCWKAASGRI